jgi:hypothetical protein
VLGEKAITRRSGLPDMRLAETPPDLPSPVPPLSDDSARRAWRHRAAVALSILVHILLILCLIYFARTPAPLALNAIPVQLVPPPQPPEPLHKPAARKPPEPPKPKPKPKETPKPAPPKPKPPPPQKPPQHGPLASVETGNPNAPPDSHTMAERPPSGAPQPKTGSEQPKTVGTAAEKPARAEPPKPATLGHAVPQPKPVEKPLPREGGARRKLAPGEARPEGHHAKYPGPDASKDAYLAYVNELILQNRALLSADAIGDRHGGGELSVVVRRNGTIVFVTVTHTSGWPDIDHRAEEMVNRLDSFPPVPQYFGGPSVTLTYDFVFPIPTEGEPP